MLHTTRRSTSLRRIFLLTGLSLLTLPLRGISAETNPYEPIVNQLIEATLSQDFERVREAGQQVEQIFLKLGNDAEALRQFLTCFVEASNTRLKTHWTLLDMCQTIKETLKTMPEELQEKLLPLLEIIAAHPDGIPPP